MKKNLKLLVAFIFMLSLSGCGRDSLSNDQVYTTIYPIEYLTNYLYGEEKNVDSIYPNGAIVATYELTDRQKDNYSRAGLFVYNGLTNEKELAREFLNSNADMLLIDVSYGLNYEYSVEELWLSPNNYLMLAKNIKNNLIDYTTSTVLKEEIEDKYNIIEEELSYMDAELRQVANDARSLGSATLVVSSNKLAFLENYGFNVVVLNGEINEASIESYFNDGTLKDIYLCDTDELTEFIASLEEEYEANVITVDTMYTLTDEEEANNETYLTIMRDFIGNIRNTTLGQNGGQRCIIRGAKL